MQFLMLWIGAGLVGGVGRAPPAYLISCSHIKLDAEEPPKDHNGVDMQFLMLWVGAGWVGGSPPAYLISCSRIKLDAEEPPKDHEDAAAYNPFNCSIASRPTDLKAITRRVRRALAAGLRFRPAHPARKIWPTAAPREWSRLGGGGGVRQGAPGGRPAAPARAPSGENLADCRPARAKMGSICTFIAPEWSAGWRGPAGDPGGPGPRTQRGKFGRLPPVYQIEGSRI
eukprot:gene2870-1855_t